MVSLLLWAGSSSGARCFDSLGCLTGCPHGRCFLSFLHPSFELKDLETVAWGTNVANKILDSGGLTGLPIQSSQNQPLKIKS